MSTGTRQDASDITIEQIQTYTLQLILDQGADEAILQLNEDDADNLFDWLVASSDVYFDVSRRVLMFGTRPVGS
jgi:hypothetical protein